MKKHAFVGAAILLSLALTVAGCGGSGGNHNNGNLDGYQYFAYVGGGNDEATRFIKVYQINEQNGALVETKSYSTELTRELYWLGVDANNQYLYAIESGGRIYTYPINQTNGELGSVKSSISSNGAIFGIISNNHLYAMSLYAIYCYNIQSDGTLTAGPSLTLGATYPCSWQIDSSGRHLYVAFADKHIGQYNINADGSLTAMAPEIVTVNERPMALTLTGQKVYVTCNDTPSNPILVLDIQADGSLNSAYHTANAYEPSYGGESIFAFNGVVYQVNDNSNIISYNPLSGSPYLQETSQSPSARFVTKMDVFFNKYLYLLDQKNQVVAGGIYGYQIASNGSLTPLSFNGTLTTGVRPYTITFARLNK